MSDLIVILILFVIFFLVFSYIIKQKKKGVQCIGCSSCASCSSKTDQEQERHASSQERSFSHTSVEASCQCQNNEATYPACECSTCEQKQKH